MYEWKELPWPKLERLVFKLQKRIYRATQEGNKRKVRKLQRLLVKSWSAKCLAVRRVTQDNQGKKTAGVDGIKELKPNERLELVGQLKTWKKVKPTRRVWIPKPGRKELRPLGIPVMYDRALQGLLKQALEPEWEAKFEGNSYGFRSGRGCHDAIEAIFSAINKKAKWVLDADIAKCFDKIGHEALLTKVNTSSIFRRQIRAWLTAGVIDRRDWCATNEGTPQGGVISPLLANVALHGLEEKVMTLVPERKKTELTVVRYADDFVVIHKSREVVEKAQKVIAEWLRGIGLELKPEKTRIAHTLHGEDAGFDFLGFNVRQYEVVKNKSGRCKGKILGFKTLIKPSEKSVKKHKESLKKEIDNRKSASQEELIMKLNPMIRGWANYFRTGVSKETYSDLDDYLWKVLWRWAKRRHPNKSGEWIAKKYWSIDKDGQWRFRSKDESKEVELLKHSSVEIVRHVKVKGDVSPYNGDLVYWSTRLGKSPDVGTRVAKLMKMQKGKCRECGLTFTNSDKWEVDHIKPLSLGGSDQYNNLQLLHKHCHDKKTTRDGSGRSRTHDKGGIVEEPDEVKVSRRCLRGFCEASRRHRTVLKTPRGGNTLA